MIQVRDKDEILHVQATKDENLNSQPNRDYGWAFDLVPDNIEDFLDIVEDSEPDLQSLAGTEALYYPADIDKDGNLYVLGQKVPGVKVPHSYIPRRYLVEQIKPIEPKPAKDTVGLGDIWRIRTDKGLVFVISKTKPEINTLQEVLDDIVS